MEHIVSPNFAPFMKRISGIMIGLEKNESVFKEDERVLSTRIKVEKIK